MEVGAQNMLAQQAERFGLFDSDLQTADGQGIFGANIDVAIFGADGVTRDDHPFDDGMGVAFQHRPVHKRARVPFIRITDYVLGPVRRLASELPLQPRGKASATASAQARLQHLFDDFFGRHLLQCFLQRRISIDSQIIIDRFRVDKAAIRQNNALLLCLKGDALLRAWHHKAEGMQFMAMRFCDGGNGLSDNYGFF